MHCAYRELVALHPLYLLTILDASLGIMTEVGANVPVQICTARVFG